MNFFTKFRIFLIDGFPYFVCEVVWKMHQNKPETERSPFEQLFMRFANHSSNVKLHDVLFHFLHNNRSLGEVFGHQLLN